MKKFFMVFIVFILFGYSNNLTSHSESTEIKWTEDELRFLDEHKIVKIGIDPKFVPFEFVEKDGSHKGISAEYLEIISKKTGITFELMQNLTWPEAYDKALNGEIDVLPGISKTEERKKYFLFSDPYYFFKRVIVINSSNKSIKDISDLENMTVSVQRNSSHHSYLLDFENINLSLYDSVEVALTNVANGKEVAFVGNLATTNYLIRSNGLTNLKFISFEEEKQQSIHIAVRKDWPELVSIVNKVLNTVEEEEKIAISNKWIGLENHTDYSEIIKIIAIITSILLVIFCVSIYWIVILKKEIRKRIVIQKDLERAKKEAEIANSIKSSFMARMSHEIRTPLNAIIGMAYLLKKTNLTVTQFMYIEKLTQASNNMLSIINDILDYSKIEAGKVEIENVSFSLDQVIQDVVSIALYKISEQGIDFKLKKDPQIPNWFFGDSKRIQQILLNIINNAAKFTNVGEVYLDISLISKKEGKYYISFIIKDTGIGMSEKQVAKLFEPFTQADISINRRFGGTGLGLSIVKNLIDMMSGEIKVFSTLGEGSTFIVNLSFEIDEQKEGEFRKKIETFSINNINALVLEKTGTNMNIINSYLNSFGIVCELTTSQSSAVTLLESGKEKPFNLFIIDYETPIEGGFKFIENVKKSNKISVFPKTIMLLPMMREDLFEQLNLYGINIGVTKPIIPSVLFNSILEIFSNTSQLENKIICQESDISVYANKLILLVEDNKTNQLIAKSLLEQAGFKVIIANDGIEGVELYSENKEFINLILMDLHMPNLNGYDASKQIRKLSPKTPIVAMTADVIQGVKNKCEESGINYYISKPFEPENFIKKIKDIIDSEKNEEETVIVLDKEKGLKFLGNNQQIYNLVIKEYYKENQNTEEKLSIAISEKRYDDAAQIIHKIKSSSANIGATSLYKICVVFQKVLKEKEENEIEIQNVKFVDMLNHVLEEIKESI